MSDEEQQKSHPQENERARAVFSQEDFDLIRVAIAHYSREVLNKPEAIKYMNLYHRLGRIT